MSKSCALLATGCVAAGGLVSVVSVDDTWLLWVLQAVVQVLFDEVKGGASQVDEPPSFGAVLQGRGAILVTLRFMCMRQSMHANGWWLQLVHFASLGSGASQVQQWYSCGILVPMHEVVTVCRFLVAVVNALSIPWECF